MSSTPAVQVYKGTGSTTVVFAQTPEGRAALSRSLAMLGTTGQDIKFATAGVNGALAAHRRAQATHRRSWAGPGTPSPAQSRQRVRDAVDHLRFQRGRLDRGDDALVFVLDAKGQPVDPENRPVLLSTFLKASHRPFDRRFDFNTERAIRGGVVEGFGAYHGADFCLQRVRVGR